MELWLILIGGGLLGIALSLEWRSARADGLAEAGDFLGTRRSG